MDEAKRKLFRALRREKGLTQADLAKLIGVNAATISNWERGRSDPQPSRILAYQHALIFKETK